MGTGRAAQSPVPLLEALEHRWLFISEPFTDLEISDAAFPNKIQAGAPLVVSADVTNIGNVADTQNQVSVNWKLVPAQFGEVGTANPDDPAAVELGSVNVTDILQPNVTKTIQLSTTVPSGLGPGNY